MKKFIKKLIFFLFPIVASILLMDIYLRSINSLYKEKVNGLLDRKDSIEILILGNSHANYGVDPNQFSQYTYNLANVNQSIYFDKKLTLRHLKSLPNLKHVLISLDYHSLSFSSQGVRDTWSYYGNGIKYKDKNYLLANLSPFLFGYTPKVSISLVKHNVLNKINSLKTNAKYIDFSVQGGVDTRDSITKGFIGFSKMDKNSFSKKKYKLRADPFTSKINKSTEKDEVLSDLRDFIKALVEEGIEPILFSPPLYKEYIPFLSEDIIQENEKIANTLCSKFNIQFWNYAYSNNFEKDDFHDCDHLNKKGAAKFSKVLNSKILQNY